MVGNAGMNVRPVMTMCLVLMDVVENINDYLKIGKEHNSQILIAKYRVRLVKDRYLREKW